jgi:hypothetical protein
MVRSSSAKGVGVPVGVDVGVLVAVAVPVAEAVGVAVAVAVAVGVGVNVGVTVAVGVAVGVIVGMTVGVGVPPTNVISPSTGVLGTICSALLKKNTVSGTKSNGETLPGIAAASVVNVIFSIVPDPVRALGPPLDADTSNRPSG